MNNQSFEKLIKNITVNFNGSEIYVDPNIILDPCYTNNSFLLSDTMLKLKSSNNKNVIRSLLAFGYFNWLPLYFFNTPASSTHKYHPKFANLNNGLVLHTVNVINYVSELCELHDNIDNDTYNELLFAAFFHDMFKYGDPNTYKQGMYTDHGHPIYAANFFKYIAENNLYFESNNIYNDMLLRISDIIASHMGKFTTSKYSTIVLPLPVSLPERILHKADYLASRKENSFVERYIT